jgi:chemotaxis protein MotB
MLHLARFPHTRFAVVRISRLLGTAALGLALAGCVAQDKYNALKLDRDGLAEQLAKAQSDQQSAQAQADSYKTQLAQFLNGSTNKDALLANDQQQIAALQSQYDDLNRKYTDAMQRAGAPSALPPALTSELQNFAQQNPDLVDFDSVRGIVKFKSDVTFDVGDATLKPSAREAITRFASILNSSGASSYELMVAGHTDNQRVSNPRTIAAGNKDNWYLSCHRAISVGDALIADHVAANRLAMVGYADQRPIASNASASGQAANRRVEVLILPTQVHGAAIVAAETIPAHHHSAPKMMMNKDGEASIQSPMNK